jgi:hypothetical protein
MTLELSPNPRPETLYGKQQTDVLCLDTHVATLVANLQRSLDADVDLISCSSTLYFYLVICMCQFGDLSGLVGTARGPQLRYPAS